MPGVRADQRGGVGEPPGSGMSLQLTPPPILRAFSMYYCKVCGGLGEDEPTHRPRCKPAAVVHKVVHNVGSPQKKEERKDIVSRHGVYKDPDKRKAYKTDWMRKRREAKAKT